MSAVLLDEFSFEGFEAHNRMEVVRPMPASRRSAPCERGVPIVAPVRSSLRLTDRGIAVVLTLVVALFVAGLAVMVGAFLSVSNAPVAAQGWSQAAGHEGSVLGG